MAYIDPENPHNTSSRAWSIQPAGWRDITQLHHLEKVCFKDEDVWPFWDLIGILTFPGMVRFKAVMDERMIGFIGGEKEPLKNLGWVTTLAVLHKYRRQGIALALLTACEKALGMRTIRLSVRVSNQGAIQLYKNANYQVVNRWERYYAGGEDALVFEKSR